MNTFICPVCHEPLQDNGSSYVCINKHNFDKSKFGYVNLLMSNQSSLKHHGDDRLMVRARKDFLSKGYYSFLLDEIIKICKKYLPSDACLLDAGCGECYYSDGVSKAFNDYSIIGVDISKDALEFAGKRGVKFPLAVASLFELPVPSSSQDTVINCFSPKAEDEFKRVLKDNGILIRIVPLEEHLFSLKEAIYKNPYLNDKPTEDINNLKFVEYREIRKELYINDNIDISNLFKMTPYYYKTGRDDQEKLLSLSNFTTQAAFGIFVYRKEKQDA